MYQFAYATINKADLIIVSGTGAHNATHLMIVNHDTSNEILPMIRVQSWNMTPADALKYALYALCNCSEQTGIFPQHHGYPAVMVGGFENKEFISYMNSKYSSTKTSAGWLLSSNDVRQLIGATPPLSTRT